MSTTENPEEPDEGKGPTEILSSVKLVLKSASNLCNEGDEATVKSAKVCFRVGESGTAWQDKTLLQGTSTLQDGKQNIEYNNETFSFNTANIRTPELVVRVYGIEVKDDAPEVDETGVKTYLGEAIILIDNNPTNVNKAEEEQKVTLQDGSREDVVVTYILKREFVNLQIH